MKRNVGRVLVGLVLIGAAVLLLGAAFGFWGAVSLDGWWTLFLIIPGLSSLFTNGPRIWNLLLIGLGVWLLARQRGWIHGEQADAIFWAVILLVAGIWFLIGWVFHPKGASGAGAPSFAPSGSGWEQDDNEFPSYSCVFSGREIVNRSPSLRGMRASAVFGGIDLNLRDAVPAQDITIELNAIFGGIDLYAPTKARIRIVGVPVFGGYDNYAPNTNDESLPLITVKCVAVFGGVDVK